METAPVSIRWIMIASADIYPGQTNSSVHPWSSHRACALRGRSNRSVAQTNKETPAKAKPPCKLPVLSRIHPIAYGPADPPRFATEQTKAIPAAAADPVKNSLGSE